MDNKFKEHIQKLNYAYAKANTKSKKQKIVDDLFRFSEMCHEDLGINDFFSWEYDLDFIELWKSHIFDNRFQFGINILDNKDIFLKISNSAIDSYALTNYPLNKYYIDFYEPYHELKEGEIVDLICSFLNKFDNQLLRNFEQKVAAGDLIYSDKCKENFLGCVIEQRVLNKNIMLMNPNLCNKNTIQMAAAVIHEYGHCYEMDLHHKGGIKNNMIQFPFYEISSQFFEYAFVNYLLENNIYVKDVNKFLRIYFCRLFEHMFGMNIYSELECVLNNNNEYEFYCEEDYDLEEKEKQIENKVNYYGGYSEGKDFRNCYLYGLGRLCSPYLYEMYKQDPKYFMKEFQNALLTYQYTNDINTFERVGVTADKLIEGKTLRRVLDSIK